MDEYDKWERTWQRLEDRKRRWELRDDLHLGRILRKSRLTYPHGSGPRERAFVKTWFSAKEYSWHTTLRNLLSTDPTGVTPHPVTAREATVAAELIRWLGTNVGFTFLTQALNAAGYEVVENERMRRLRQRAEQQRTNSDSTVFAK